MPAILGTRVYWTPATSSGAPKPKQILKNSGYITVTLQGVQYKADGSWWQRQFGGSDRIAIATQVTWFNGADNKSASVIQDVRKIGVPSTNALAIGRIIALKVPASADGLELKIGIHAIHDDNLAKTLQLLNSEEFKQPLQLAPVVLGQALAVANMVKKTFTNEETDPLAATFPGVLAAEAGEDPIALNRLVEGHIVIVVKQDDSDELDFNPSELRVAGNSLLRNGEPLPNTYMLYNVSFDKWRGADNTSASARKFADASSKADELLFAAVEERTRIVASAHDLLMQGKGILDTDDSFRPEERAMIAAAAFKAVADKIKANSLESPGPVLETLSHQVKTLPLLAAAVEPSEGEAAMLEEYARELAEAGLPLGMTLAAGVSAPDTAPLPLPIEAPVLATQFQNAACPVQNFGGITDAQWLCLQQKAAEAGIAIHGTVGQATEQGVTIGWNYDATAQTLELACLSKPFLYPCSMINAKLRELVDGCASH